MLKAKDKVPLTSSSHKPSNKRGFALTLKKEEEKNGRVSSTDLFGLHSTIPNPRRVSSSPSRLPYAVQRAIIPTSLPLRCRTRKSQDIGTYFHPKVEERRRKQAAQQRNAPLSRRMSLFFSFHQRNMFRSIVQSCNRELTFTAPDIP